MELTEILQDTDCKKESRFGIKKSTFKIEIDGHIDGWLDPDGIFFPNKSHHHVEAALDIILQLKQDRDYYQLKKIRDLDTGEFLILKLSYIALESGHLLYIGFSSRQLQKMNLTTWNEVIIPKTNKFLELHEKNEKQYVLDMLDYYSKRTNQFHSVSKKERVGFLNWRKLADKYDVRF
jgi:hypothetical protein